MGERLVVIGGDAAGMSAASQARRRRDDLEIVVIEKGRWTSYAACGIPYLVGGEVDGPDRLIARTPQQFRDKQRIDVRIEHEVTGIDLAARQVEVRDHIHDRTFSLGFDQLMIATGGRPVRPQLPGIDLGFVHGVQTLGDGEQLLAAAESGQSNHVVVVGGGYIGLEMAEAFVRWGADVTIVEQAPHVMSTLDPDMAELVEAAIHRYDIDLMTNTMVTGFEPGRVLLEVGSIEADLVVLGIGVQPNSELAAEAGVRTGVRGAISVDRRQRTSVEGVYAAGDCCESFHRVSGGPTYVALGTVANRQGRVAGINIGGGYATFPGVAGTAVTKLCETEVGRTGLSELEATAAGFLFESTVIEGRTRAHYFPGAKPIMVKLVVEQGSGRILGGQVVGEEGAAKRIDVLAAAVTAGMTVEELVNLDLSYAPPFSPVWDPVAIAARQAVR
jgi:NADPH-dependent 2,4-dienoyl-CoA reductase/sulfur reductase-like enzyme